MLQRNVKIAAFGFFVGVVIALCLLYVQSVSSQVIIPKGVSVQIYNTVNEHAVNNIVIDWLQTSEADMVCVNKNRGANYILIGCQRSNQGIQQFSTRQHADGMYKHVDGDLYFITEYFMQTSFIQYGPYEAFYTYELPRIDR